jgi:hypothetical protein
MIKILLDDTEPGDQAYPKAYEPFPERIGLSCLSSPGSSGIKNG